MINERKLSENELDARFAAVKGLLKNKVKLVKKYGKDAEKVMYGIATKQAKKKVENMNLDKLSQMIEDALQNPKKADLNKDGKLSDYEEKRGAAIEKATQNELFGDDIFDKDEEETFLGVKVKEEEVTESKGAKNYFDDLKFNYQKAFRYLDKDEKEEYKQLAKDFFSKLQEDLEEEVEEDRFVASSMEDLEQVIRNLAHTANISEDEALEMAIKKLENMLDGRDDMNEESSGLEFKVGDKVTYLGHPGTITNAGADIMDRPIYSVSYNKGTGDTKVTNVYNKGGEIKKALNKHGKDGGENILRARKALNKGDIAFAKEIVGRYLEEKKIDEIDATISELEEVDNSDYAMKVRSMRNKKPTPIPSNVKPNVKPNAKLDALKKRRAQIMRDMEQEAEPEGGPIADKYGDILNKIDAVIAKASGRKEMDYDTAVGKLSESDVELSEDQIERLKTTMYVDDDNPRQILVHPLSKPDARRPDNSYIVIKGNNVVAVQGYDSGPIEDLAQAYGLDASRSSLTPMGQRSATGQASMLSSNILKDAIKAIEDSRDLEAKRQSDYYKDRGPVSGIGNMDERVSQIDAMLSIDEMIKSIVKEKLTKKSSVEDHIDDFKDSDAPQFKGKSLKKIKQMALASFLSKQGKKKVAEGFKVGQEVTYLGHPGEITKVNKEMTGATTYNVSYDKGTGKTKVSNIYNKGGEIKAV